MSDPYSVAAEGRGRRVRLLKWCVRYAGGVVRAGITTYEEAVAVCEERNAGAVKLPKGADPEAICTCRQQKWKCAAEDFATHLRRTGA